MEVRVADLDIVNPYFRSSDYRGLLEDAGVQVIAPRYAGTTLDAPAISGQVSAALDWARGEQGRLLLIDAGGDDVGATALGRFARGVAEGDYDLLYVVNRSRNLTHDAHEALSVLREIEAVSHLRATAVANNTTWPISPTGKCSAAVPCSRRRSPRWPVCLWRLQRCPVACWKMPIYRVCAILFRCT